MMNDNILMNKEFWADKFCEKNSILKELLLYCWSSNIYTSSCCIGHEKEYPFIVFDYNDGNLNRLSFLLDNCLQENGVLICITKGTHFNNNVRIHSNDNKPDKFYRFILDKLNNDMQYVNKFYYLINKFLLDYGANQEGITLEIKKKENMWSISFRAYADNDICGNGDEDNLWNYLVKNGFSKNIKSWPLEKNYYDLSKFEKFIVHLNGEIKKKSKHCRKL